LQDPVIYIFENSEPVIYIFDNSRTSDLPLEIRTSNLDSQKVPVIYPEKKRDPVIYPGGTSKVQATQIINPSKTELLAVGESLRRRNLEFPARRGGNSRGNKEPWNRWRRKSGGKS